VTGSFLNFLGRPEVFGKKRRLSKSEKIPPGIRPIHKCVKFQHD